MFKRINVPTYYAILYNGKRSIFPKLTHHNKTILVAIAATPYPLLYLADQLLVQHLGSLVQLETTLVTLTSQQQHITFQ